MKWRWCIQINSNRSVLCERVKLETFIYSVNIRWTIELWNHFFLFCATRTENYLLGFVYDLFRTIAALHVVCSTLYNDATIWQMPPFIIAICSRCCLAGFQHSMDDWLTGWILCFTFDATASVYAVLRQCIKKKATATTARSQTVEFDVCFVLLSTRWHSQKCRLSLLTHDAKNLMQLNPFNNWFRQLNRLYVLSIWYFLSNSDSRVARWWQQLTRIKHEKYGKLPACQMPNQRDKTPNVIWKCGIKTWVKQNKSLYLHVSI